MKYFPDRKVLSGGVAGVVTWLILLALGYFNIDVPADVQATLPLIIGYVISYAVPPADQDIVKRLNDDLVNMAKADPSVPVGKST
jgi:hypothetical protein